MRRAGFDPDSHSGKALVNVLETYPRDELFQIDEDTLYQFALAIMQLDERPRVRVLPRRDRFDRFVSVLVYRAARPLRQPHPRRAIGDYLADAYKGRVSRLLSVLSRKARWCACISSSGATSGETPNPDRATLERAVEAIVRTWTDGLGEALAAAHEPEQGASTVRPLPRRLPGRLSRGLSRRRSRSPTSRLIEALTAERPLGVDFYRARRRRRAGAGLKVWSRGRPIPLSERVPVLENMGFRVVDERTYRIEPQRLRADVWFHDMMLESAPTARRSISTALQGAARSLLPRGDARAGRERRLQRAGAGGRPAVARRRADPHHLALPAPGRACPTRRTTCGRRCASIARDRRADRGAVPRALRSAAGAQRDERAAREADIAAAIETALQAVESLDEDRILRHFVNAVTVGAAHQFLSARRRRPAART